VGYEVAGTVDAVGPGPANFKAGDRVVALTRFGGYSDVVCVPAGNASRIPAFLSFEAAAAIPVNYLTAWLMLIQQANIQKNNSVLIHAAAGGVGQAAVQICKWRGAAIFGTASASKHERLRSMGVHYCIDYHNEDFAERIKKITQGRGVDVVLDAVGGESFKKSYRSLAPLGKLMVFGISSFSTGKKRNMISALKGLWSMPTFKPLTLMNQNRGVFGFNLGHLWSEREVLNAALGNILRLVEEKVFQPVVDRGFPFSQAAAAHAHIQEHRNFGKVLLVPEP
jgi:NADPH:quinone reductase-like Zn-dependent oxidoreductase